MKKIQFLIKLKEEGKLELVEPSDNLKESYLSKSESHFEAAKLLLNAKKVEESVSMSYYAMYHCLLALLFRCGIKSENHTGSIILLKELFGEFKLWKEISFGKKERVDKQYYVDFRVNEKDCEDMLGKAEDFVVNIKRIIKDLNEEKVNNIRKELEDVLE